MAARLQYDISVIGQDRFKRVMRGVGAELKALDRHASAVARHARTSAAKQARATATGTRGIAGLGHLGEIAKAAKLQQAEEMKRHRAAMRHRERENRLALTGLSQIGRVAAREEVRRHRLAQRNIAQERSARQRAAMGFARGAGRTVKGAVGNVVGLGRNMMGMAGIAGGALVGSAVANEISLDEQIAGLANQAFREDGSAGSRQDIFERIKKHVVKAGAGGEGASAVTGGLRKFVALTGDLDTGMGITPLMTDIASATGANVEDVAATAGETMLALQQRGVKGAEAIAQVSEALRILAAQGKEGSIEFADLSTVMGKLGASTARFEGSVPELVATMGAFAQIAKRGGAANAEEATTAILRMSDDMVENAKRFKDIGVDVFRRNEAGVKVGLRDPVEVLQEVFKSTKGDVETTASLFGIRGAKSAEAVLSMASNIGGDDIGAGLAAMMSELDKFRKARMSEQELSESAGFARDQTGMQAKAAWEEFNRTVGSELIPIVNDMIGVFKGAIPDLKKIAQGGAELAAWFIKNPFEGIGAIVLASVTKDILMAGIGAGISRLLRRLLNRGGGGGGLGVDVGTSTGTGRAGRSRAGRGARMAGVALGTIGAGITGAMIGADLGADAAADFTEPELAAARIRNQVAEGGIGIEGLSKYQSQLESQIERMEKEGPGLLPTVFGGISSLFGGKSAGEAQQSALDEMRTALTEVKQAKEGEYEKFQAQLDSEAINSALIDGANRAGDALVAKIAMVQSPRRHESVNNR